MGGDDWENHTKGTAMMVVVVVVVVVVDDDDDDDDDEGDVHACEDDE